MALLRTDLRDELRLRLGEPNQSGWTADANGGTWTQGQIYDFLNFSQRRVVEDSIVPGNEDEPPLTLLDDIQSINLVKDQYEYELNEDVIDVLMVMHRRDTGAFKPLASSAIQHLFDGFNPGTQVSGRLRFYEVGENRGKIITEGIATTGSTTTCTDSDRSGSAVYAFDSGTSVLDESGAALASGDIVENVTDGSRGTFTSTTSTVLTFSALSGGSRNSFELGDKFRIRQAEENRKVLYLWPVPSGSDTTSVLENTGTTDASIAVGNTAGTNQKAGQSFLLTRDAVIAQVEIQLGTSTGTPLGALTVRIETNSSGPSGTLVNPLSKGSLESPSATGWNRVELVAPVRLAANTTYNITAEIPAQSNYYASPNNNYLTWVADTGNGYSNGQSYTYNGSAWTAVAANDHFFKLYQREEDERLLVKYTRYPAEMDANTDQMEVPDYARRALLWYAEYLSWSKVGNDKKADRAEARYEQEIGKLKLRLMQQKQHPYQGVQNVMWNFGGGGLGLGRSYPPWRDGSITYDD